MADIVKYRSYLFSVAYNILGEIQEAEDIVHDAFEYYLGHTTNIAVANEKAYLTRVVANKAIDRLKVLKKQREGYPGTWLPEPIIKEDPLGPQDHGVMAYEVLCALEQLSPVEKAVFVLRESFDYSYEELAGLCGITPANCRQILSRVKKRVGAETSTKTTTAQFDGVNKLISLFLKACAEGDTSGLVAMLKDDIVMHSDGGGKAAAAVNSLVGSEVVSKFFVGIIRKGQALSPVVQTVAVNNRPAILITVDGRPVSLFYLEEQEGKIANIYVMRNPEKMAGARLKV